MKKDFSTVLLVVIFLFGLSLLLYPSVSNWWNSKHMTSVIANYEKELDEMDDDTYRQILDSARAYNEEYTKHQVSLSLSDDQRALYEQQLNPTKARIMGYIEIPSIDVYLPIYHGTEESALSAGVGHLEGSSLPIGGESTHSVLCGHRGLPSARLFTDLDKLNVGDTFTVYVLDDGYTYEISDIYIIEPNDASKLFIVDGEDLCTLYTCTPYGINSHRLLVRGRRVDSKSVHIRVTAEAYKIEPVFAAPIVAVPILLVLLVWLLVSTRRSKGKNGQTPQSRLKS